MHRSLVLLLVLGAAACTSDDIDDTDVEDTDVEDTDTDDTDVEDTDDTDDTDVVEDVVLVNELLAGNDAGITDEAGEAEDWLELYNPGSTAVSLDGWTITDDFGVEEPWAFPEGAEVPAGGYLLVWCDGDADQGDLHADFKLSKDGETVTLLKDGEVSSEVAFPALEDDQSYARVPDGSDDWSITTPTPEAANE